jgi:hypothetical protein
MTAVILVNFSHPFTGDQLRALEQAVGVPLGTVIERPAQFDPTRSFRAQGRALVDAVGLSSKQWQVSRLVVSLPGHQVIAAVVLAELHGRSGHFPAVVRQRRADTSPAAEFHVAEVIDLQAVRDAARHLREDA